MEQFECKTKIIAGAGAISTLAGMGAKRLFLVTDPYFAKNGTAARVAQTAGAAETDGIESGFLEKIQKFLVGDNLRIVAGKR